MSLNFSGGDGGGEGGDAGAGASRKSKRGSVKTGGATGGGGGTLEPAFKNDVNKRLTKLEGMIQKIVDQTTGLRYEMSMNRAQSQINQSGAMLQQQQQGGIPIQQSSVAAPAGIEHHAAEMD